MANEPPENVTVTIEADGETDELTLPSKLLDVLSEADDTPPEVVGDIAMVGFAQQIHGAVHHSPEDASSTLRTVETETMHAFEDRFGQSFAEMTGHDH